MAEVNPVLGGVAKGAMETGVEQDFGPQRISILQDINP
jgi:hypothetical protein